MTTPTPTAAAPTSGHPDDSGYAEVNGLRLYWERYGDGPPLVLLHGGLLSIDLAFADLIPTLAESHRVIAVEQQGHGRTAMVDRPFSYRDLAADVVALLDHLGLERAAVLGHSMGGGVALELAVRHGDRLTAVVPMSASVRPEGLHPDLSDPSTFATSSIMPTAEDFAAMQETYQRLSPHPERFEETMALLGAMDTDFPGWSDEELAQISCPVLLVQGDHDFTLLSHAALMHDLIPGAQLAVLPGTTHMQVTRRASVLLPVLAGFLPAAGR